MRIEQASRTETLIKYLGMVSDNGPEIDCEIAYAFGWRHTLRDNTEGWVDPDQLLACAGGKWRPPRMQRRRFDEYPDSPPRFSWSIDITYPYLKPVCTRFAMGYDSSRTSYVWYEKHSLQEHLEYRIKLYAKTIELALCRAALHAQLHNNLARSKTDAV